MSLLRPVRHLFVQGVVVQPFHLGDGAEDGGTRCRGAGLGFSVNEDGLVVSKRWVTRWATRSAAHALVPLVRPLDVTMMSGCWGHASEANQPFTLPKPVATSSATRRKPCWSRCVNDFLDESVRHRFSARTQNRFHDDRGDPVAFPVHQPVSSAPSSSNLTWRILRRSTPYIACPSSSPLRAWLP